MSDAKRYINIALRRSEWALPRLPVVQGTHGAGAGVSHTLCCTPYIRSTKHNQEPSSMATTQKTARKPNAAFMKPLTPSATLAAVIGSEPVPRTEVTKKIWDYIKKHDLQDPKNRRNINADDKLRPLFGKDQVSMFELTKLVSAHLK